MPIAQLGQVNLSALNVPQGLVQIVKPQFLFGGVSTNIGGFVGTASWGPVGLPMTFGNYSQYAQIFGPTINRTYDIGGHVILADSQGNGVWAGVRVTDGTDTAATVAILTNCLTLTARYTGSLGNSVSATIATGTQTGSYKLVISCPGLSSEVFDNLAQGLTGNAIWVAVANAVNNGASSIRPASAIIVATAGTGTTTPAIASYTLAGGTDGVAAITTAVLLGVDAAPRRGMYALRGTGIARFALCDLADVTSFSTQLAFAADIGAEAIATTPASDTIANAASEMATAAIDSPWAKVIFGDWIIWNDTINNVPQRLTSPQALAMGIRGNLSPQNSTLNKPIAGIVGTQSSFLGRTYGYADLQQLAAARVDVVCQDRTLSNSFIFRLGINSSSNQVLQDDAYTDVTNFLAKSVQIIANQYIGQTQTPTERRQARVALQEFLSLAQKNGIIGTADGSQAFQVILDGTNNTAASAALGFQYAYVKAIYLAIVRYFVINLEGGASVTVSNTPPQQ